MNNLDKSLAAIDRLFGNYSKEEILAVLAKVRQNRQFEGPTIEEYFGCKAGVNFPVYQDEYLPHQHISPPKIALGCSSQKTGLEFFEVFFFV